MLTSKCLTWSVVIDSQLTFADNVKKLAGSCFYHLRQLRSVRRCLTTDAAKTLVHALISSHVDYCNSVLYGVCEVHLRPLQSVLNARHDLSLASGSSTTSPAPCATTSIGFRYDNVSCSS